MMVKGNGSGAELKDGNNVVHNAANLDSSELLRLENLAGEIEAALKRVGPSTANTILLSTAEGREELSQKLDEADEVLKELAPDIIEIVCNEDDTLHSALEEQSDGYDLDDVLESGSLSRSRSG